MKKGLAKEFWDYAEKKLAATKEFWTPVETNPKNTSWEATIQNEGWLQYRIPFEMTYWEYVMKEEKCFEPDWDKVKEIIDRWMGNEELWEDEKFRKDFWNSEDYRYWKNAEIWEYYIGNPTGKSMIIERDKKPVPKGRLAVNHFIRNSDGSLVDWMPQDFKETDEFWKWSTPDEAWQALSGRGGFCIVRDGKVIASVITVIN